MNRPLIYAVAVAALLGIALQRRWLLRDATGRWYRLKRPARQLSDTLSSAAAYAPIFSPGGREYTPQLQSAGDTSAPLMHPI